jgi:hypothetical protein
VQEICHSLKIRETDAHHSFKALSILKLSFAFSSQTYKSTKEAQIFIAKDENKGNGSDCSTTYDSSLQDIQVLRENQKWEMM